MQGCKLYKILLDILADLTWDVSTSILNVFPPVKAGVRFQVCGCMEKCSLGRAGNRFERPVVISLLCMYFFYPNAGFGQTGSVGFLGQE